MSCSWTMCFDVYRVHLKRKFVGVWAVMFSMNVIHITSTAFIVRNVIEENILQFELLRAFETTEKLKFFSRKFNQNFIFQ